MMGALRVMVVWVALCSSLSFTGGCASRRQDVFIEEPTSIERPAVPLEDEKSFADRAGEVMVVVLVVGLTVGAILLPILLF